MSVGIYCITNTLDGKVYIGSSVNMWRRFRSHRQHLRLQKHANPYLQYAWNFHGEAAFEFKPLLECSVDNLLMYEQRAIDSYKACDRTAGYNYLPVAGSRLGSKQTEATKAKIAAGVPRGKDHMYYGKRLSDAAYKAAADLKKQFGISAETRARMSVANKGKVLTEEHKLKIGASNKGRAISLEARAKTSATKRLQHQAKLRDNVEAQAAIALTMA